MLSEAIFNIQSHEKFEEVALRVFRYQYLKIPIYQRFCNLLGVTKTSVKSLEQIPYLPIRFFKQEKIYNPEAAIQKTFTSSGTTGSVTSKHHITNLKMYEESFLRGFQHFYGSPENYTILALLPSYLEREGSSLIYMFDGLIQKSNQPHSGFYLDELEELAIKIQLLKKQKKRILLVGVTFALLDVAEKYQFNLSEDTIIMETGGMKGRRKEMIRSEVHTILKKKFGVDQIHSEYGMTELLSQAYSLKNGLFTCPPWMQVYIRDPEEPQRIVTTSKSGGINIIDLANINSCSFIATQDLGKKHDNDNFEILGRFDHSDLRGCNLMVF